MNDEKCIMGSITPSPFIEVDGVDNFRDIGGLSTPTGTVRRNTVFRSGRLNHLTPKGAQTLHDLGITKVFELRMPGEPLDETSLLDIQEFGIEKSNVQIFPFTEMKEHMSKRKAYASGPKGYHEQYIKLLVNGGPAIAEIFEHIRDKPKKACLVHCSLGRDRTGIVIALILGLAGATDEDILEEYQLSEQGLARWMTGLAEILMRDDPSLREDQDSLNNILRVRKENLQGTLDTIRTDFGGAESYLEEYCGFSKQDVQKIKSQLVE